MRPWLVSEEGGQWSVLRISVCFAWAWVEVAVALTVSALLVTPITEIALLWCLEQCERAVGWLPSPPALLRLPKPGRPYGAKSRLRLEPPKSPVALLSPLLPPPLGRRRSASPKRAAAEAKDAKAFFR